MIHKLTIIPFKYRCKYVLWKLRRKTKKRKKPFVGPYDEIYWKGLQEIEEYDREHGF